MADILEGVRVLDFGRYLAGPFCAALLADLGADVIRIDKIGGSEDRDYGPAAPDGAGACFLQANRNKRSMTLTPSNPAAKNVMQRLIASADVVITNMAPQTLVSVGLDYPSLRAIRPDIILTTVSAFGSGGPNSDRVGFDGIGQAESGAVYLTGFPDRPVKPNLAYVDWGTALSCAYGTLAALMDRARTGQGQHVEGSLLATAYNFFSLTLVEELLTGVGRERNGSRNYYAGPSDLFATKDGWIITQVISNPLFKRWAKLIGKPELVDDPQFATDQLRGRNGEKLSRYMSEWCASRTTTEAISELEKAKLPAGRVNSPRQALEDPHARAIGLLRDVTYPGMDRPLTLIDAPIRLSRHDRTMRAAPVAGEHTDVILSELGFDAAAIDELRAAGAV
jgi:crotonobetainyl-CoA:carnitine CoA-transferase CaiB-like acyl-CoA transferase